MEGTAFRVKTTDRQSPIKYCVWYMHVSGRNTHNLFYDIENIDIDASLYPESANCKIYKM